MSTGSRAESWTVMRSATQKPSKRPLPLFLLFFPTSLLAFLFLLACYGFLCFTTEPIIHRAPFSTHHSIREVIPRSPILAVREEIPTPVPVSQQRSVLLQETGNGSSSSTVKWRMSKRSRALLLRTLHPNSRSRLFSAKAEVFFQGCGSRFFMTWISSLESFGRTEMFGMESVFKFHPDACLLVLSDTMDTAVGARLLQPFTDRGYWVTAMSPDYTYLFKNTPAERWFARLRRGEVKPGDIPLGQNLSNLLRLAVLYKFGGTYIDTDVIVMKSFSNMRNVIGAQTVNDMTGAWSRLNNAVLIFDKKHPLLYKFIEEFALTFDGSKWGHNGPYLVSRVVARVAGRPGYEVTVLPQEAFYPVGWSGIGGLFHGPRGISHSNWIAAKLRRIRDRSFAVHLWNRQSKKELVEEGSVIAQIFSDGCVFCNSSVSSNK